MSTDFSQRVRNHPKYPELVNRRKRLAWTLTGSTLGVFFTFVLVIALSPQWLAIPISSSGVTTVAVPIGVAMIVFFWLSTGLYVRRATRDFDGLTEEILREAAK